MCIRDRLKVNNADTVVKSNYEFSHLNNSISIGFESPVFKSCLLYTSDAADERSSVDLGGRRIIKKKKNR